MLTVQTQQPPDWLEEFLYRAGATHYKSIGTHRVFDGIETIGRAVVAKNTEPEPLNTLIASGEPGANAIFDDPKLREEIDKNPGVSKWLLYNESAVWTQKVLDGFIDFNQQLIYRARQAGIGILVGAINTGHPKLQGEHGADRQLDIISRAVQGADGYAVHCYHPNNLLADLNYLGCRYRDFHDFCEGAGRSHPGVYVMECGIDRQDGGPDHGHSGWRIVLDNNWPAYRDMLVGYSRELKKDAYVVCGAIYIAEGSYGWGSFELNQEQAMDLADRLAENPPPPPPPPPPPDEYAKYSINGVTVTEEEFRSYFGKSFWPTPYMGGDSPVARVEGLDARNSLGIRCYLRMADGSVPSDLERYSFALDIYDNRFRTTFKVEDGIARAEWGMGHEGWPYHPESGEVGACTCHVTGLDSDEVTGCGYFSSEIGQYTHADLWLVITEDAAAPYRLVAEPGLFQLTGQDVAMSGEEPGPEPDLETARAALLKAKDLQEEVRVQLDIAAQALGVQL